jgi:hypothetical protein
MLCERKGQIGKPDVGSPGDGCMNRIGCVYKLTAPNAKAYIGLTFKSAKSRFSNHVADARRANRYAPIQVAIRRFGPERFKIEVLFEHEEVMWLYVMERILIAEHRTYGRHGLNASLGGEALDPRPQGYYDGPPIVRWVGAYSYFTYRGHKMDPELRMWRRMWRAECRRRGTPEP